MDVVDIKIQEYEERITLLEKKVSDLEKSNLVLEKMMDKNITFSSEIMKKSSIFTRMQKHTQTS